jgi:hypothetical protein
MVELEFESWQEQEIFIFYETPIPSLGPTHPLVQWVMRFFPRDKAVAA